MTTAPVIRQFLAATTTDNLVTLTTATTTEAGWWLLAVQQWDWDPGGEQVPPSGNAPASAWTQVGTTGHGGDNNAHLTAWLRRVTTAGAQQVIFLNGAKSDDNHARLWALSGLRSTTPILAMGTGVMGGGASVTTPAVTNPDGPALLIAVWLAGWEPGTFTNLPAGMVADAAMSATYSTTVSATQTLTTPGTVGPLTATYSLTDTDTWAALAMVIRGPEPVPPPTSGAVGPASWWAGALATTADPHLDLPLSTGMQRATFRFELVDAVTRRVLGKAHPLREPVPELSHDAGRTIPRQLKLSFARDDTARIDPIAHRIAVSMHLAGTAYPLGRYMIVDHTLSRTTSGPLAASALVDEMFLVDQPIAESFCPVTRSGLFDTSIGIDEAIDLLLRDLPIRYRIEATSLTTAGTWPAGTSRAKILADLALDGGYATPWFDHHGTLRLIQAVDPASAVPQVDLDTPPRVLADSIAEVTDLLVAPNRFVVISNDTGAIPIVGVYDLPPSAPHSADRRGFVVAQVVERQVADTRQAATVAQALARAATITERVELSTPPDPRHDGHTLVRWRGQPWTETSWTMPLTPGGVMRHVLKRSYQ